MVRRPRGIVRVAILAALVTTLLAGGAGTAGAGNDARQKKPPRLTVLVTNDDGVAAPGIDAVVEALRDVKRTKIVVVAPADNNSGTGGRTTPGGVTGGPATTASGYKATAVQGFPADSVDYALDVLGLEPDVVISGANLGQNLGPISEVSGTVGAARQAARRGIPALAISQQIGDAPDFPTSARLAVEWLREHRKALATRTGDAPIATIDSINVPNCPGGRIRGLYETVLAPEGTPDLVGETSNCASTATMFANDAEAFNNGYATLAEVPVPAG